jgi:oligopeptide transport system permease protein
LIKYTLSRIGIGLLTIFVLVTLVFFLMKVLPGGPFDTDRVRDPKVMEIILKNYNLDKPAYVQYLLYLQNLAKGDLGTSFKKTGTTVSSLIVDLAPVTMRLGGVALLISIVVGLSLGIIAALTRHDWIRTSIVGLATVGISVPGFLMAIFLIYTFAVNLRFLPVIGLSSWKHYIMPSIALSFYPIAFISRMTRSVLTEVLKQDYIVMAKSKGLSKLTIILRHALKNVLIPIVTYLGPLIAGLMTGSFVIENLFAIPGIGRELVAAIQGRDYPVIVGLTIFIGAFIVFMNLLADLALGLVDPRIKVNS